jgi:hypothetical protein
MREYICGIECNGPDPHHSMALELCMLASFCDAAGDIERRDVALALAADLLRPSGPSTEL